MKMRLKQARIMKGQSLREAAKGLGMSHENLRKMENKAEDGTIRMDSTKLIMFVNYYGVSADYLMNNSSEIIELTNIQFCKMPKYI